MDLTALMRSPSLALDPSPVLGDVVRRRARRVRRRRQALAGAAAVVLLAGGASLVPRGSEGAPLATAPPDHGIDDADSGVLRLTTINGADVVAYFEDGEPCVASVRVKRDIDCEPAVSPQSRAVFPALFAPDNDALRVDGRQLVAGLVQSGTLLVRVDLDEGGPVYGPPPERGRDWAFAAWWAEVPRGARAVRVTAVGEGGQELGSVDLQD